MGKGCKGEGQFTSNLGQGGRDRIMPKEGLQVSKGKMEGKLTETSKGGKTRGLRHNLHCQSVIGGHRHRSQCRRYPTSDIDICYSDIGDKYVRLKNVIPISESELIPISDIEEKKYFYWQIRTHIP
jgi:hypothetical protein